MPPAGPTPPLIIPVRFNHQGAVAGLQAIATAGAAAGNTVTKGMQGAQQATHGATQAIHGMSDGVLNLMRAQIGLQLVQRTVGAMGNEFKKSADYVRKLAEDFAELRRTMQAMAALREQPNTSKFAFAQVQMGARAGLLPEEHVKAQEAFLNFAGIHVGPGPEAKVDQATADRLVQRAAASTKAAGEDPASAMEFMGTILAQSKGKITEDEAIRQFNEGYLKLKKGPIKLSRGMPLMSGVMAHQGVSAGEAATMLSLVQPAGPGEEQTSVESAFRALEEMRVKETGEDFGVTNKMSKYEAFKAFGKNIAGREAKLQVAGKTDEEIEVEIAQQLEEAGVAKEIREKRGLVRGMARQGITLGGFEQFESVTKGMDLANVDKTITANYEASEQGRANRRKIDKEMARAWQGEKEQMTLAVKEEADNAIEWQGRKKLGRLEDVVRNAWGFISGAGANEQVSNEEVVRQTRTRARSFGIPTAPPSALDAQIRSQNSVDAEITGLLSKILAALEKQNDAAGALGGGLSALMPRPADRM